MSRRSILLVLALAMLLFTHTDASACGDKFLRVGRSPRFRAYASIHPSPILVYAPRWTRKGIAEFEQILKRGGHKPFTVTTGTAMSEAVATGRYGVVITSYSEAATVKKEIAVLSSRPALLPLVYKATKAEAAEAAATYGCLLEVDKMTPFQALEEIDRLLDARAKGPATGNR